MSPAALAALAAATPAGRETVPLEPSSVYVFEMRTGRVIDTVPIVGNPRWSGGLQNQGSWSVDVALRGKATGPGYDPKTLEALATPYRFGYAICQGSNIWQAGPVVSEQWSGGGSTTISGGGLWHMLTAKRLLINPNRADKGTVTGTDADVIFGPGGYAPVIGGTFPPENANVSLHTIAKRIVQLITQEPGGGYPVIYPPDIAGTSIREYPGYDLASPGQRLLDLTQVVGGPEIVFKPEFVDGVTKQAIQWRMQIGNPALGLLDFSRSWDSGKSIVSIQQFATDGLAATTRDFERGNGMNRDLPIGYSNQVLNPLDPAAVLLETVGSAHTSATDVNTLNSYAQNAVQYGQVLTSTLTARVRTAGDDGSGYRTRAPHQAEVNYGDNAVLEIRDSRRLPDGSYNVRIITRSSASSAQETDMVCQIISRNLR